MKTKFKVLMEVTVFHDDDKSLKSAIKEIKPFQDDSSFGDGLYHRVKTGRVLKVTKTKRKLKCQELM